MYRKNRTEELPGVPLGRSKESDAYLALLVYLVVLRFTIAGVFGIIFHKVIFGYGGEYGQIFSASGG